MARLPAFPLAAALAATLLGLPSDPARAARTLTRNVEPVVVTGAQTPSLAGTDVTKMVVFKFAAATNTWTQIPFQIDERTPGGSYFTPDDGLWDANDELAFMAQDCGDQAVPTQWPAGVNQTTRDEIAVTDPLTGNQAWAYLCTAPSVTPVGTTYVSYSGTATNQVTGTNYVIDFVDGERHVQSVMAILSAGGGDATDLVDRSKTRAKVAFLWYTEDDVAGTHGGTQPPPGGFP